jgi:diguanylate cyclase (GGDEF)-like protein/PAS domain S-box-containing protein
MMIVDAGGAVSICNRAAHDLLGLPNRGSDQPLTIAGIVDHLGHIEIVPGEAPRSILISGHDGRQLELSVDSLPEGGAVIVIVDVSHTLVRQRELEQAEARYRSLFDNSVYGIYRDTLDGRPVRANPALAAINGYASEAEHIAAVTAKPVNWYVEECRAAEFHRILQRDGRVKDFVSEIYRHRTGERLWITENAWYVRDAEGNPLYIEGTIQDASERVAAQIAVERLANKDHLTGASNRFHFINRLEVATVYPENRIALFCIDLDRFKTVNDTHGHAAGDAVLKEIAARLSAIAGEGAIIARFGGDEFAVLVTSPHAMATAAALAAQFIAAMQQPIACGGEMVMIGASAGIALFPDHAADAEELLHNADLALYGAKSSGRNCYRLFDLELKAAIRKRKEIETELREAVRRGELELYFQPVVDARTSGTVSFEALMRWNHPRHGMIPPAQFIPVAEEAGLMRELGAWAVKRACQQAMAFPEPISVAVNVSANQFRAASLYDDVKQAIEASGISPARLILEITETAILADEHVAHRVFARLRQLGVRIALDDFGTGYSSLSYLQRFAFDKVKIDRSFVAGMLEQPANLAIIRAVIGIGRDLGIPVVAEGVETQMQVDALLAEGCALIQGYSYGRPKPYTDVCSDLAVRQLTRRLPHLGAERPELLKSA